MSRFGRARNKAWLCPVGRGLVGTGEARSGEECGMARLGEARQVMVQSGKFRQGTAWNKARHCVLGFGVAGQGAVRYG